MHRGNRNVARRATYSGPKDPYDGLHPDDQPRRLWHESFNDAWPHIRDDFITGLQRVSYIARDMLLFHVLFQVAVTVMQTLGVHYRSGRDDIGLCPRAFANIKSTENLLGLGGIGGLIGNCASLARKLRDLIIVGTSKVWAFVMIGVMPELKASGNTFGSEPHASSTGVRQ